MNQDMTIGRWLAILHRHARMYICEVATQHGLAGSQFPLLMRPYDGDCVSQDDLVRSFAVDEATAPRLVAKLERKRYILRVPGKRDKRIKRVALTDKAKQIEPALKAALHGWSDTLTEGLTEDERTTMIRLLQRMAANAEWRVRKP